MDWDLAVLDPSPVATVVHHVNKYHLSPILAHIRMREVSPRPRERPVIHTSAVWSGQGWAVWISHPGQVGDRAGALCGSDQCAAGRTTSRVGRLAGRRQVPIAV